MNPIHKNVIVIGAGPGGLQLAHYLQEVNEDYIVLEGGDGPGAYFERFPRHRTLISINKRYTGSSDPEINLRWDWNSLLSDEPELRFTRYSERYFPHADDYVRYLRDFASRRRLQVRHHALVEQIRREEGELEVRLADGDVYRAPIVVVATGLSKLYVPNIPGIENAERYDEVSIDPADFRDQRVLVIGKGNSAFEVANHLVETTRLIHLCSPNPLKLAWQTHYVGHLRAINNDFLDTYQLKSGNAVLDAVIDNIELPPPPNYTRRASDSQIEWGTARYKVSVTYRHAAGEREDLLYDRVILCTGWQFDRSIFHESCMPATTINKTAIGSDHGKYPAITPAFESVNVPGLFFAGALTASLDHKRTTSAFIHGFRYNSQALFNILRRRRFDEPWPSRELEVDADVLADSVLARVNRSSAMWQQFGFFGDVIAFEPGGIARLYIDVPLAYVAAGGLGLGGDYYTVTLEYGSAHLPDPFAVERVHRDDVDHADKSQFLHPIVRRIGMGGHVLATHHVIEDLASQWIEPVHVEPLRRFFQTQLARI